MNRDLAISEESRWLVDPARLARGSGGGVDPRFGDPGRIDLAAIILLLLYRRWMVLGAGLAGLLLAVVSTMLTTPLYRASGTLEVNPPTIQIMDARNNVQSESGTTFDFVVTQVGLLSSRAIAERTAQDLNLAAIPAYGGSGSAAERLDHATGAVLGGIKVVAPESGTLIPYSYTSPSPQMAAAIANQLAASFINAGLQRRYDASSYARNFLSNQINKTRGDLEKSERQLVAYAQAQGIINTGGGGTTGPQGGGDVNSLQGESLVALNRALADATARRVAAEGAFRQGIAVGATSDVTTATAALRQQLAQLQADYQDKRTLLKPDHPDMVSLKSRIDELRRQIAGETAQASAGRSNTLLADYRGALAAEEALAGRVAGLKESVLNLRGRSIQYNIYQREVDTNRSLYDALLQRYKEVGVSAGIGASPVSIVDHATVPTGPFKPSLVFNVALGVLLGLLVGVGAAIGTDYFNDTIKTRDDVRSKLGLACLGAIPKAKARGRFIDDLREVRSLVSEAYSSVVASLRLSTDEGSPKMVLITSSRSHEGKSSSALALAQSLARQGQRALLVDCDLRKPVFRAAAEQVGMTRLLTDENARLADHIVPTQFEGLYLLPAGPIPPNPSDLLSSARASAVLEEAAGMFDAVLIDAPPVMGLADSLLLASIAHHVIFIVESGQTRTRMAIESVGLLRAAGAHLLGAILTKSADDGGYGYYGYGYGPQSKVDRVEREIMMVADEHEPTG